MRYDHKIYFCRNGDSTYNEETGDYGEAEPTKVKRYASIVQTGEDRAQIVYGSIREGSLTLHLQNHYPDPFDYIEIDEKKYHVDHRIKLRSKDCYVVSEVI